MIDLASNCKLTRRNLFFGLFFFMLTILVASFVSVFVVRLLHSIDASWSTYILKRGDDAVARRILLAGYFLLLLLVLPKCGWLGIKDCGFSDDRSVPDILKPAKAVVLGMLIAFILILPLVFSGFFFTQRFYQTPDSAKIFYVYMVKFAISGIAVGLMEETLCRGIFFRVLSRANGFWKAASITSLVFAVGHYIEPSPDVFAGKPFVYESLNVFLSSVSLGIDGPTKLLTLFNLILLGIVFCAMVKKTGSIWMAIGAHMMWVWVVKINTYLTHLHDWHPVSIWIGRETDGMDSLMATLLLSLLIILLLSNRPRFVRYKAGSFIWRILPGHIAFVQNWIRTHFHEHNRDTPDDLKILKEYSGCRVYASGNCVCKEYWPKNQKGILRFTLKRSRAKSAFVHSIRLQSKGVALPTHFAWAKKSRFGLKQSETLVTQEITDALPLDKLMESGTYEPTAQISFVTAYAELMASFHVNGFSNRDLKDENILVTGLPDKETFWAVDMDGVRYLRRISRYRASRDLHRVGCSLSDKGWLTERNETSFFERYNSLVPERLKFNRFPKSVRQ